MNLLCLNCWGGTLHDRLLPYLASTTADVLCLQEIVHTPVSDKAILVYRDGDHVLDQQANLFQEIQDALPDFTGTFCPAAQGVLWDGDVAVPSQWGLATFVRKALPVVSQHQGFVHKAFSPHGYGDHPRSRSAHAIRVFDYAQDRFVSIAHMHGLRDLQGKGDTPARRRQAERFLALLDSVAEAGDLRILCGDFNVRPDSETLALLGRAGFTELVTTRTNRGTRNSFYKKAERHADYLLVDQPDRVNRFDVVFDPEVSDHCPLVAGL
ncbi:MAG: endonuclease/exonuclease/phosphatase family protein [Opitutales bacterium]